MDWSVVLCSSYWKVMHLGMNAISLRRSKAASDCQGGCKMGGMVKKLSAQSDKMSDRSTELTIWMSHQIVGKTSCPDKQGIGELREENLRIKQGMGGNWELNLNRNSDQMSLMQRDTTIWPDLSYFVAPKENENTRKYFISNLFSEKITCHSK